MGDECDLGEDDCHDNAVCTDTDGLFTCACKSGYSGDGKTCTTSSPPTSQTTSQTTIKPTANIKITTTRKMATKLSTLSPPTSQTTSQTTIKPTANIKITTTRKMATKLSTLFPPTSQTTS